MKQSRFLQIPAPNLAQPDYEATLARVKAAYFQKTGHWPDINDPETFELEQLSYEREQIIDEINRTAQQNLLGYSTGSMLDNLGALTDTLRLPESSATTSGLMVFTMPHPAFVLPAGYQVMAGDGQTLFVTTEDLAVTQTQSDMVITLSASVAGVAGNGFLPGEIAQPVTSNAYVASVTNTTTSQGGAEIESDDSLANRIFLAPSKFSVAGPYDAYKYFTLSTSSAIADAYIDSPEPCEIVVYAVLDGGGTPSEELKSAILDKLSDKTTRPLGDRITIADPTAINAHGDINIEVYRSSAPIAEQIRLTVAERANTVTHAWSSQLGADIVPEVLIALGQSIDGVYRCTTTIEYQELDETQFSKVTIDNINVTLVNEDTSA